MYILKKTKKQPEGSARLTVKMRRSREREREREREGERERDTERERGGVKFFIQEVNR